MSGGKDEDLRLVSIAGLSVLKEYLLSFSSSLILSLSYSLSLLYSITLYSLPIVIFLVAISSFSTNRCIPLKETC